MLLVDDVRNTGQTFQHCADLIAAAGGTVVCTAQIVDRGEAVVTLPVPNVALVEYPAPGEPRRRPPARCARRGCRSRRSDSWRGRGYFLRLAVKVPPICPPAMATVPFMVSFSTVPL